MMYQTLKYWKIYKYLIPRRRLATKLASQPVSHLLKKKVECGGPTYLDPEPGQVWHQAHSPIKECWAYNRGSGTGPPGGAPGSLSI